MMIDANFLARIDPKSSKYHLFALVAARVPNYKGVVKGKGS